LSIFGNKFLVLKDRILGNKRIENIKKDVWKYMRPIFMRLGVVWRKIWITRTVHVAV